MNEEEKQGRLTQMRDQLWAYFRDNAGAIERIGDDDGNYKKEDDVLIRKMAMMVRVELYEQHRQLEIENEDNWQESKEWREEAWVGIRQEKKAITRILETGPVGKDDVALCRRILYYTLGQILEQETEEQ